MNITVQQLQKLDFFQEVPSEVIQTLLNVATVQEYRKKEVLFRAKETLEQVFFVLEGEVMIYNLTKHGNRKIIFILGQGKLLNSNIISDKPIPVFCEALRKVRILKIPRKTFVEHMERQAGLMRAVMRSYEQYIWRTSHQLKNTTGNMQTERKVAAKLWKLARDFGVQTEEGVRIDIDMTITLMADLLGAPRENISRACKILSDKELIRYQNRRFTLLDADGLAEFYKQ